MGVNDLFKHIKPHMKHVNIFVDCRGQTVGVDGHVWLHQFAFNEARSRSAGDNTPIVKAFVQRARYLIQNSITPVFVFDGARLPAKQLTDKARAERRAKDLLEPEMLDGEDVLLDSTANAAIRAAVSINWDLVSATIDGLRKAGFAYFVAPYEGDSQLAHLSQAGVVDSVFTIDSDLIVLGCKRTYVKIEYWNGGALRVDLDDLSKESRGECFPLSDPQQGSMDRPGYPGSSTPRAREMDRASAPTTRASPVTTDSLVPCTAAQMGRTRTYSSSRGSTARWTRYRPTPCSPDATTTPSCAASAQRMQLS